MNKYESLYFFTNTKPPASAEDICRLEKQLALVIPDIHKEFLLLHDGASTDYGVLYGLTSIAEMYEANQLAKYTPGYICVGGDNGGYEFLMEARADAQAVYYVDAGALDIDDILTGKAYMMQSIFDWLSRGNGEDPGDPYELFEKEDDGSFYALADIRLVKFPAGGVSGLYRLLCQLQLKATPALAMEYIKSPLPIIIGQDQLLRKIEPLIKDLQEPDCIQIVNK